MATINPSQDYDAIHTLTFAEASGTCNIRLYLGSSSAYSGTVYYRAGTSGSWTQLDVSGTGTTFSVTSTTMQIGHSWNKSGDNYMTPSFNVQSTNLTNISISQKAVLSGSVGDYFMYYYARGCTNLTSLDIPDTSSVTSIGSNCMYSYAYNCTNLTSLDVPDTSSVTSVGDYFMYYYANGCTSLTSLYVPDTSSVTSVGNSFMFSYAYGCTNLTSLSVPDTSSVTSVGNYFMYYYADSCSKLTSLILPAVGWFANHDINWSVPSGRLNYLKGYVTDSSDLTDWQDLTTSTSPNTLYINYIRSTDDVVYITPTSPSISPSISKSISKSISASVSPSASISPSISKSISRSISASISPSASVSPSISPSASLSPSISKSLSPSVSPSISKSISKSISASVSPSLSPSASISKSISKSISASISPSASVSKSISKSISASVSPSASLSPSISKSESPSISPSISASISASESPSVSKSLSPSISPSPSPDWKGYTRGTYATLPLDDSDLTTSYSTQDYTDVGSINSVWVGQETTGQFAVHQYKDYVSGSSGTFTWNGKSSHAPSLSAVYLQIYNQTTNEWEVLTSNNLANADTNFTLESSVPDLTNYKNGNVVSCRVYQEA